MDYSEGNGIINFVTSIGQQGFAQDFRTTQFYGLLVLHHYFHKADPFETIFISMKRDILVKKSLFLDWKGLCVPLKGFFSQATTAYQFRWQKANSFRRSEKLISREWPRVDIGLSRV